MKKNSQIRVIIAGKYFAASHNYLKSELPEISLEMVELRDFIKKAEKAQIIIPAMAKVDEEILKKASCLRLVQQWGTGLDGVDIAAATDYQVAVANVPTVGSGNAESVAEWYVMAALALSRRTCEIRSQVSKGHPWGTPLGQALYGRTAGLIGFGGIGKALAIRLRSFQMKTIVIKRHPDKITAQDLGVKWIGGMKDLPRLLKRTDYLFLCVPLNLETRNMINERELFLLPKGAFILNAARGPIINKEALMKALDSGHLRGAALDVYWEEPPEPKDPILDYSNVLATPHIAGVTDVSYQGIASKVAENIRRVMSGKLPLYCANPTLKAGWLKN
ncbi:MAG: 2-hydroxyacid dehydrogenase [Atribacterota bacterium]|nr:2-hydroxyacid dehydrogenase [Atribacterota bacterium]